jgi:hypothetical protein
VNSGRSVFSQLMDFQPMYEFHKCVERCNGNYKVQSFSCWDQYLCMAFAQLTYRESLRDIQACLRASEPKLYHMGFRARGRTKEAFWEERETTSFRRERLCVSRGTRADCVGDVEEVGRGEIGRKFSPFEACAPLQLIHILLPPLTCSGII